MPPGRQQDKVWKYAEANPNKDEAVKKPYIDIFQKKAHSDHATKFKLFLAFDCAEFMKSKPLEWAELVAGLTAVGGGLAQLPQGARQSSASRRAAEDHPRLQQAGRRRGALRRGRAGVSR